MAAQCAEPLVLRRLRVSGIFLRRMRNELEYLHHAGALSGVRPSVALDVVPALRALVAPPRLVQERRKPSASLGSDSCLAQARISAALIGAPHLDSPLIGR